MGVSLVSGNSPFNRSFGAPMRILLRLIFIVLVVVGACVLLTLNLRAKLDYEKTRAELNAHAYTAVQIDADDDALLARIRADWQSSNIIRGFSSDALEALEKHPSVSNLVDVVTYRLPEYAFVSPSRNTEPLVMATILPVIRLKSIDQLIYVSDDRHPAFIRCLPTAVMVYTDEEAGLRETLYYLARISQMIPQL